MPTYTVVMRINWSIYAKCVKRYLARSKSSINVSIQDDGRWFTDQYFLVIFVYISMQT